jgi:hypothetical protein
MSLPIGRLVDSEGEIIGTVYILWVHVPYQETIGQPTFNGVSNSEPVLAEVAEGTHTFTPWALFALLLLTSTGLILDIFIYRTRLVQSRVAMLGCILMVGWYCIYAAFWFLLSEKYHAEFHPEPWAGFPAVACIFAFLAFRAILKDEALVRSLDRLR